MLLLAERWLGQPQPRLGLTFPSAATGFQERLHFSLEVTGVLFSAVGSALFIAAHVPPMWFIAATLVGAMASVYGLLAWLALKYWRLRLADSMRSLGGDLRLPAFRAAVTLKPPAYLADDREICTNRSKGEG